MFDSEDVVSARKLVGNILVICGEDHDEAWFTVYLVHHGALDDPSASDCSRRFRHGFGARVRGAMQGCQGQIYQMSNGNDDDFQPLQNVKWQICEMRQPRRQAGLTLDLK